MTGKLPPHPPEEPWHVHQPFPPHHHHYHDIHHVAPECDDQLAVFSGVGRGLRGDGYKVVIKSDSEMETYLEGLLYDAATNTYSSDWISENINGGKLMYQYNLRPHTNPQTFTITFRYVRPNRESGWVWTTPAIPYIWDADNDGLADVDSIIGVGVGTLFMKKTSDPVWFRNNLPTSHNIDETANRQEKLLYPNDWTRDMFNAPKPGDPWTVNLQYGIGGDIDAPNIEDLAKILGVNVDFLRDLVENRDLPGANDTFGTKPNGDPINTKEYIDQGDAALDEKIDDLSEHIHQDMGFGDILINDGNADTANPKRNTIKKWIDWLNDLINDLDSKVDALDDHIHEDMGFGTILVNDGDSDSQSPKRNTIKKWLDWIIGKLGFGNLINNFGSTGATSIKGYIDALISGIRIEVENPTLYTQTKACTLVLYELPHNAGTGVTGIPSSIPTSSVHDTAAGLITISYFDVLPSVNIDVEVSNTTDNISFPTGDMIIACETSLVNGAYKPVDLSAIRLANRDAGQGMYMKPPVINPENLSQSGSNNDGTWQIFTGAGNVKTKAPVADPAINGGWPWTYTTGSFYLYMFNRSIGATGPNVAVDYARTYSTRYDMAAKN